MSPLLRRIAIHGGLTAIVLGVVGLMLAEMASIWTAAALATGPRGATIDQSSMNVLRWRVPLTMAAMGFVFVALGEVLLAAFGKGRKVVLLPAPPPPDSTERLLEELLAQAEAKASHRTEVPVPNSPSPLPAQTHAPAGLTSAHQS